jgi:hypothetical protein
MLPQVLLWGSCFTFRLVLNEVPHCPTHVVIAPCAHGIRVGGTNTSSSMFDLVSLYPS